MTLFRAIRFAAIGFGIAIAALAGVAAYAYLDSETIIERHYPLFSMDVYLQDRRGDAGARSAHSEDHRLPRLVMATICTASACALSVVFRSGRQSHALVANAKR